MKKSAALPSVAAHPQVVSRWIDLQARLMYDEATGRPEDGLAPGTAWGDVPVTWACPECGVAKADFEVVEL